MYKLDLREMSPPKKKHKKKKERRRIRSFRVQFAGRHQTPRPNNTNPKIILITGDPYQTVIFEANGIHFKSATLDLGLIVV